MKGKDLIMFRLLDRKEDLNSRFMNMDKSIDDSKKMNFTHRYMVLNPYFIMGDGKNGGVEGQRVYRRYIPGCPHYSIEQQDKEKYVFDLNCIPEFKTGNDIVVELPDDKLFIDWMNDHPNNTKSKYHDKDKHEAQFFTYNPKEAVQEEVKTIEAEDEAMEIVRSLKNDPERLRAIGNLFKETSGIADDDKIYLELRRLAKENPASFTSSIASNENKVLGDVMLAKRYAVINRNVKGYYYEGTEGVIFEPNGKSDKDADSELVKFLMSKEGEAHYSQILVKIQQSEIAQTAPKGKQKE